GYLASRNASANLFVIAKEGNGSGDVRHRDVRKGHVLHDAALGRVRLHPQTYVCAVERAVDDCHSVQSHGALSADGKSVPNPESAVGNGDIAAKQGAGLLDDIVVSIRDIAVLNELMRSGNIDAVGIQGTRPQR